MTADSIEHVISYWIVFQKFQSPALGGYAVISHWVPFLFFSVSAGALADRLDPRRIIQAGMLLFIGCSLGWGLLFMTGTLELWHAVVLFSLHGIAGVLWGPASQLLIHHIVGPEQLHSAVRLLSMSRVAGLLGGPAVGGAMLLAIGPSASVIVGALIYLPLTLWLVRAPLRRDPHQKLLRAGGGIIATARAIAGNRMVVTMTLLAGASSFLIGNAFQAQMPEFAADLGHGDADVYYSMLLAANAAGALAAGVILESRGVRHADPRIALLFAAGFLNLAFGAMSQTLVQLHAPPDIRGRVIGLYGTSFNGMRAFSGLTVGMGGSLVGVHWSLAISALVLALVTAALYVLDRRGDAKLE